MTSPGTPPWGDRVVTGGSAGKDGTLPWGREARSDLVRHPDPSTIGIAVLEVRALYSDITTLLTKIGTKILLGCEWQ